MAKKTSKRTIVKAHTIADRIKARGGVDNPYAVGMAQAKKSAAKRKRARAKR
jgi:hypothetical protein